MFYQGVEMKGPQVTYGKRPRSKEGQDGAEKARQVPYVAYNFLKEMEESTREGEPISETHIPTSDTG